MNYRILPVTLALILWANALMACDICGCAGGMTGTGIMPQFRKNFVGLQYRYSAFESQHLKGILSEYDESELRSKEVFQSYSLWGRAYLGKRFILFASLPVVSATKYRDGNTYHHTGLGDASAWTQFLLFDNGDSLKKKWRNTISLGAGIKVPTGKFDPKQVNENVSRNMLPGTGSWDQIYQLSWISRIKNWGIVNNHTVQLNGPSPGELQFGNRYQGLVEVFRWIRSPKASWMPRAGYWFEHAEKDRQKDIPLYYSGYTQHYASAGLDYYRKRMGLMLSAQIPVSGKMAAGQVSAQPRIMLNVIFYLTKN